MQPDKVHRYITRVSKSVLMTLSNWPITWKFRFTQTEEININGIYYIKKYRY